VGRKNPVLVVDSVEGPAQDGHVAKAILEVFASLRFQATVVVPTNNTFAEFCRQNGFSVQVIPHGISRDSSTRLAAFRRWWDGILACPRMVRLCRRLSPRLVFVRGVAGWPAIRAAGRMGIPTVWYLQELCPTFQPAPSAQYYYDDAGDLIRQKKHRFGTFFLASSRAVSRDRLGWHWVKQTPVLPEPVHPRFFAENRSPAEARQLLGLPQGVLLLGTILSSDREKTVEFFLRVARIVSRFVRSLHYVFPNELPPAVRQQVEQRFRYRKLPNRLHFLTGQANEPVFYRACNVVACIEHASPTGRSALQAMAVGTPVVVPKWAALTEVVWDGITGRAIPLTRFRKFAEAVLVLLNQPEARTRLVANAKAYVRRRHSVYAFKRRLRTFLERILTQQKIAHPSSSK
jgi:glycosyltransferase involved in cell wall biosynthesis